MFPYRFLGFELSLGRGVLLYVVELLEPWSPLIRLRGARGFRFGELLLVELCPGLCLCCPACEPVNSPFEAALSALLRLLWRLRFVALRWGCGCRVRGVLDLRRYDRGLGWGWGWCCGRLRAYDLFFRHSSYNSCYA